MSIFKAAEDAVHGVLADQWKVMYRCGMIGSSVLLVPGTRVLAEGYRDRQQIPADVIPDGSIIEVMEGQAAMLVFQGQVMEVYQDPGRYAVSSGVTPSIFGGSGAGKILQEVGRRFAFGGNAPKEKQYVYYYSTRPVQNVWFQMDMPFRHVTEQAEAEGKMAVSGEFAWRIEDPVRLYNAYTSHASVNFTKRNMEESIKKEMRQALQQVLGRFTEKGIAPEDLPNYTDAALDACCQLMAGGEGDQCGLVLDEIRINHIAAREERKKVFTAEQAEPAPAPAQAETVSPAEAPAEAEEDDTWQCECGFLAVGNFCSNCGKKRPDASWICPGCGKTVKGNFCNNCGTKRP